MATVPFFSNTSDDTHCLQASLKMVLKYFEPEKEFDWNQLDKITNKPYGKWTWPMAGLAWLATNGYEVIDIEHFDYARFKAEGIKYMEELWGEEVVQVQKEHSDIALAQLDTNEFMEAVTVRNQIPTIADVKKYLRDGYLVICMLNARKLEQKSGFVGHSVLIIDYDTDNFMIHDPGLPALEGRKVKVELFESAWSDPNDLARNLAAIKHKIS